MNILAIDLGKFNSMCCFFDTNTQEHRFQAAATTRSYLTAVLKNYEIDLVVMEACGPSGWINDLCQEHGIKTLVCSTHEEAWRWANVKRKTDKDDALKLARLAMMRQRKPVHIPRHEVREHRTLVKYRQPLEDCSMNELWRGQLDIELTQLDSLTAQLAEVERRLEAIAKEDARIQRL